MINRLYTLFLACLLISFSCLNAQQSDNSPGTDHYVVIVSMDGFRWDYCQMYHTPFLDSIGHQGVYARMRPSYPSKTFPNHYTIATGLVPDHHGIIANRFVQKSTGRQFSLSNPETKFDPSFYGGEPIWITAKRQGVRSGIIYWPGSDVPVGGAYPDIYHKYFASDDLLTFDQRIAEVTRLLSLPEDERPHLVMCYFDEPDHTGHVSNPYSADTRECVEQMDALMARLYAKLQQLPTAQQIDFIITSDHGMAPTSPERMVSLGDYFDLSWIETVDYSLPTLINARKELRDGMVIDYADSIVHALRQAPHCDAWRKADVPAYLQFGSNENIGDVVVNPHLGWVIGGEYTEKPGAHGYDPFDNDMQVIFRAIGPDFKTGYQKPTLFQNTCIYPLLCHLLGIEPLEVDGCLEDVQDMLCY